MPRYVPPRIERRDVEAFARDGAVCVRNLLDSSWVDRMRRAIDRLQSTPGPFRERYSPDDPGEFVSEKFLWTFDSDFRAAVLDSPAAEAACRLMRASRVNVFYDHLMVKEPGATLPHAPGIRTSTTGRSRVSRSARSGFAFDRVDRSNGAMEFVAGSHRSGSTLPALRLSSPGRGRDGRVRAPAGRGRPSQRAAHPHLGARAGRRGGLFRPHPARRSRKRHPGSVAGEHCPSGTPATTRDT